MNVMNVSARFLSLDQQVIKSLRGEIETLQERIRQLENQLVPPVNIPSSIKMTNIQLRILGFFLVKSPSFVHVNRVHDAVFPDKEHEKPANIMSQHFYRINRLFAESDLDIWVESRFGHGYRLSPECAERLRNIMQ